MMNWLGTAAQAIWGFLQNLLPVERWVQALGSVLKYLGLAFIIIAILFFVVLAGGWGLSDAQRFVLLVLLIALLAGALIIVMILAAQSGDLLLSPYERSLRLGRRYGIESSPLSKSESTRLPSEPKNPELPPPPDRKRIGN